MLEKRAVVEAAGVQAPMFAVDPFWPKPLPNHWILGQTIGVSVDAQDHVWIIHRASSLERMEVFATTNPPASECCLPAPPVLEFDQAGNLLRHWGGPGEGFDWPDANHGITIDYKGNVWIGGNGAGNHQVLKFTQDGKFLLQIGHPKMSKWEYSKIVAKLKDNLKSVNEHNIFEGYKMMRQLEEQSKRETKTTRKRNERESKMKRDPEVKVEKSKPQSLHAFSDEEIKPFED